MKTSEQLRKDFIDFWTNAPRNFKEVPNVSLVPNIDSTLLFVNSGMFPLAPYLGGQPHPLGKRLVDIQRCLRTNYDEWIEIGDNRHTLMFEMIGDWSLGDFTKADQIPWILEFWVKICGMDPKRLYVSVFEGDVDAPRDNESIELWQKAFAIYGVKAEFSEDIHNIPKNLTEGENWPYRIFPYSKKKNWWERAHSPGELGGPTSEMFYDMGVIETVDDTYHVNDDSGRFIEIGNNVFMEYKLDSDMKWQALEQKNIDFGGGFERVNMIVQGRKDIFETDIYESVIAKVEELSRKSYKTEGKDNEYTRYFRILADHSRAATFILADGIYPSNKDQGYILRRFIRRLVRYGLKLGIDQDFTKDLAIAVIAKMSYAYPHLKENEAMIIDEIEKEEIKFRRTLDQGLKEFNKIIELIQTLVNRKQLQLDYSKSTLKIYDNVEMNFGQIMFFMYETYGFPSEMFIDELSAWNHIEEEARKLTGSTVVVFPRLNEDEINNLLESFKIEELKHREQSRSGAEQKFKGGLADGSVETTKLHTAHHLLLAAMQKIIDSNIKQRGSNITSERLRMDFNFDRKLTPEEIQDVENFVNTAIESAFAVERIEMPKAEAEQIGAQMEFGLKYPDIVSLYVVGDKETINLKEWNSDKIISKEFCGGPHVSNTSELAEGGKKFKIIEQENVGADIKRIKAKLV